MTTASTHRLGEVGSTNDELLQLASRGAPSGTAVAAERQTAGRGRRGRAWLSPVGQHVYVSILWRPPASLATGEVAGVTLDVGLAVADVLTRLGVDAWVKWPNDVWVGERKIAGILSELHDAGVVLGIGVNVNVTADRMPDDIRDIATSMAIALGRESDRDAVLDDIVIAVRAACDQYAARGGPDTARYASRCITLGRRVRVEGKDGEAVGIARDGSLLVLFDATLAASASATPERVVAGDVELGPIASVPR